jgi:hypothetical protein
MALLPQITMTPVLTVVDTDKFTRAEWIEFIHKYVAAHIIFRCIEGKQKDLFPLERLKQHAIAGYLLAQEVLEL